LLLTRKVFVEYLDVRPDAQLVQPQQFTTNWRRSFL
jgi:hypothetical protein